MKPIKRTVKKSIEYILDPVKMGDETLVFTHHVNKELAALEFSMTRDDYLRQNPNKHNGNENRAYHIVQSHMKHDNVTPEMALEVAKKTIKDYTQDYAYVIAVHTDKDHLHTHIIMNAYAHNGKKKLNTYRSVDKLLEISNKHCLEFGLSTSTLKKKQPEHVQAKRQYYNAKYKTSHRTKMKHLIDEMIDISKDFDEFIDNIQNAGVKVKVRGGLSFLLPDAKQPIRLSSLKDENYDTVEALQKRVEEKDTTKILENQVEKPPVEPFKVSQIRVQSKPKWINYYSRDYWRRKSDNLASISRIAKMLSHMRTNNIKEIADYTTIAKSIQKEMKAAQNQIRKLEKEYDRLEDIYKNVDTDKQEGIVEEMKAIRAQIRPLDQQYKLNIQKQAELTQFKQMFETQKAVSRKRKHQRGLLE